MAYDWMREPNGWSMPSSVPETSRMNTGTSTVPPETPLTVPTVTTSEPGGGRNPATRATGISPRSSATANLFIARLLLPFRPRRLGGEAVQLQRARGNGGLARAGGVAEQRDVGIDLDGHARVELDLGDDAREAGVVSVERDEVRQRAVRLARDLEGRLQRARLTGAMDRGVARAVREDHAQRQRLRRLGAGRRRGHPRPDQDRQS